MPRSASILNRLAGTRYRTLTSVLVLGYALIIAAMVVAIFASGRLAHFRVSATTEYFSALTSRDLHVGRTWVGLGADAKPRACHGALIVPAGSTMTGATRSKQLVPTGANGTYILVASRAPGKVRVQCESGKELSLSGVTVEWPASDGQPDTTSNSKSPPASGKSGDDRIAIRVNGSITLGHQVQADTPTDQAQLLNAAVVVAESREWPSDNLTVLFERTIGTGNQLSFRGLKGGEADVEGLILMKPGNFEVSFRFIGSEVLATPAGAPAGAPVVMAPGFLDRVKSQAEWGAWVLVASLLLAILEVFRSYESAPESARKLGARDVDAPKESH